ncbi:MAG TPA: hypothetical protein VH251_11890 [Verrucomicrobiae bacterium]|jgi:hypothetical protein|nr:hypothetical protein [Verrucomicrobiae bacterium]
MPRGILIAMGTFLGGFALYVASVKLLGVVGREPSMTIIFVASFVIVGVAMFLLTRRALPRVENLSLEEMEKLGLLAHEGYQAKRAFQVEEVEDEGVQYFIELRNGTVLFLCGQYLYDYEPADGDARTKQPRKFPCTEFSVLRHKQHGWIVDIEPGGTVLEPECEAPPFGGEEPPADGDIISDRSYDEIKRDMMKVEKTMN